MEKVDLELIKIFFDKIKQAYRANIVNQDNNILIIFPKSNHYHVPNIMIKSLEKLSHNLKLYILAIQTTNIKSTKIDESHDISYFFTNLIKNLTNYDCNNLEEYISIYTQFITDETFSQYDQKTILGKIDDENNLLIKRSQDYYGFETPYVFKMMISNKHLEYELPLIRYGIYTNVKGEKVARIYGVQRKRFYDETPAIKNINKLLNQINSGVKYYRNVPPSMMSVLSTFIGLLNSEGIHKIIVPDFMNVRYLHFMNVDTEEQREKIQTRVTDTFLKLFLRLNNQFDGVDIVSFPNDIDSFMHIFMKNQITGNNNMANTLYSLGYNHKIMNNKFR